MTQETFERQPFYPGAMQVWEESGVPYVHLEDLCRVCLHRKPQHVPKKGTQHCMPCLFASGVKGRRGSHVHNFVGGMSFQVMSFSYPAWDRTQIWGYDESRPYEVLPTEAFDAGAP